MKQRCNTKLISPTHGTVSFLVHLYSLLLLYNLVSGNCYQQHFGNQPSTSLSALAGLESIGQRLHDHDTKRLTIRLDALVRSTYFTATGLQSSSSSASC